jgi:hypothetical protein
MKRIQRRRDKGWVQPEGVVYVGRGSKYGNPFVVGDKIDDIRRPASGLFFTPEQAVTAFRQFQRHIDGSVAVPADHPLRTANIRKALAGKTLACWCPLDKPCHADVLLEIANRKGTPDEPTPTP